MLDKILKISSISGALLIFCGVLKLIIYYRNFDIDIVDYLSMSEIITSFLDDLNIILLISIAFFFQSIPLLNVIQKNSKIDDVTFLKLLLVKIYPIRYRYVGFFIVVIVILLGLLLLDLIYLNYLIIYILVFSAIQLMTFISINKAVNGEIEISTQSFEISIFISIAFTIILLASFDTQKVYISRRSVVLKTDDKTIICNHDTQIAFLGKTDSFVFLRDIKNQCSIIIPATKINEYTFSKK